jgi:hypothetical protein
VSLYLQIAVGDGLYLLDAAHILEIRQGPHRAGDIVRWQEAPVPVVDLHPIFDDEVSGEGRPSSIPGCCVLFSQASGEAAALIADRADSLVELGEAELCHLPPIGPLGNLLDAVATRSGDERPLLRLRGEHVLAALADFD